MFNPFPFPKYELMVESGLSLQKLLHWSAGGGLAPMTINWCISSDFMVIHLDQTYFTIAIYAQYII